MTKPKMTANARAKLLAGLEDQIKAAQKRTIGSDVCRQWVKDYWAGRADGLNQAYRFIATGEWET